MASAKLKVRTCSSSPRRLTRQVATSPSMVSYTYSQSVEERTRAITASPHSAGRPLITAMFCIACMGCRPSSIPHWMATRMLPGFLAKSFGMMLDSASISAKRRASSSDCGAKLKLPRDTGSVIAFTMSPCRAARSW
ncbi:hypothetical protein D3C76_1391800 [compost metagenome]